MTGFAVVRLTPAGSFDTSFNGTGYRVILLSNAAFPPPTPRSDPSRHDRARIVS